MLKLGNLLKPSRHFKRRRLFLSVAAFTALLATIWWLLVIFYDPGHLPASASYYKDLNLNLAQTATYYSPEIKVVKDFGISNNVKKQLISFDVPKDGLSEYGLMTLPKNKPASGKYPVIILCHGYANPEAYSTLESYIGDMDFYSQHGFAVIKPDYRGNGFSIADGTADSAYYSMGYNTDIMSVIAAVKSTNYLNKSNINLWGHSMGGYLALRAAVLSPEVKNLILLSAPAGTPQDMYSDYTPISDENNPLALDIRNEELATYGTPLSNPSYWNKTSPLNYLKNTRAHIEINVGTADKIVPPKFSADLDKALTSHNIAHQYFIYPGAPHGLGRQRPQIWTRSLKLLQTNKF